MTSSPLRVLALLRCMLLALPVGWLSTATSLAGEPKGSAPMRDWVPLESLSPEQQSAVPTGCCGAYIDPLANRADAAPGTSPQSSSISGDESEITRDRTIMTGHVELLQGSRRLTGDRAELFNEPQSVNIDGNVTYREPGFLLQGSSATVDLEQDELSISGASYLMHEDHIHGSAERIERNNNGVITLTKSTYTYCEPKDPLWQLRSKTLTLDAEAGEGVATHVRLELGRIPVFYFPYLRFPIGTQRQSGFLMPSITSGEDGLDISVPYYFNLAPNYDLMFIPRHIGDRGTQLGGEFRHLHKYFDSTVSAAWLPDDKQTEEDRWIARLHQKGGDLQPWSTQINFNRVSDPDYFEDLGSEGLSITRQTHLKQFGSAGYMTDHWDTEIEVESFQTLRDNNNLKDPYKKLPGLSANGSYFLAPGLLLNLDQELARFDSDNTAQVTGDRLTGDYELSLRKESAAYYAEPSLRAHYRSQQLDNSPADDHPEVLAPGFTFDSGLFFEKNNADTNHILEPRMYYTYTDYENQDDFQLFDTDEVSFDYSQLYESRRVSGNDLIGDNNQTSLGIEYRIAQIASQQEWMRFGIGQTLYHDDRRVNGFDPVTFSTLPVEYRERYTRSHSPLAALWQWNFFPNWQLDSQLAWDDQSDTTETGKIFLHHSGEAGALFTIGYQHKQLLTQLNATNYIMETLRQGHLSGYWPLDNQWSLMAGTRYDFSHKRGLENVAGFQYEDCCWKLRTLYRQWKSNPDEVLDISLHEQEQAIYFEILFKGLASTGKQIESLLDDNIYGYSSR